MNRNFLFAAALALASHALAADQPAKPDKQPGFCGGYSAAKIDTGVREAAEFAVKAQAKAAGKPLRLVKILKAEQQVVAGLNYRMEIEASDGGKPINARAVVWKKLDGSLALTSWEPLP